MSNSDWWAKQLGTQPQVVQAALELGLHLQQKRFQQHQLLQQFRIVKALLQVL